MNTVKKRGWVKNVAIAFLATMLVLTFFSNHIMNRSLPEVAAQYTSSGTITARIRGTGSVEANETYEVMATQTRKVNEVRVRLGSEVKVGDVLITLSGSDSDELEAAQDKLKERERALEDLVLRTPLVGDVSGLSRSVQAARNTLAESQRVQAAIPFNQDAFNQAQAANNAAQAVVDDAQLTYDLAEMKYNSIFLSTDQTGLEQAKEDMDAAELALRLAREALRGPKSDFETQDDYRKEWEAAGNAVRQNQLALDDAIFALSSAQREAGVNVSINTLDLRDLRSEIEDLKKEITELQADGTTTEIKSVVNGVVTEVRVRSGHDTSTTDPLMIIEVVDLGYSLSFSVSPDQARRVNLGDQAEVDRGWFSWGEEIRATLIGIGNDPEDPRNRRLLHFNISGDIESGDVLNLTLAQRSENYNIIVPNSAIRQDTNGDFVLVVMSNSGPLGNRFIATRADVNVVASDDFNSAVTGGLQGWDFVITTSSAPIESGDQVRLVDNP